MTFKPLSTLVVCMLATTITSITANGATKETCETSYPKSIAGETTITRCGINGVDDKGKFKFSNQRETLSFNGTPILSDEMLFDEEGNIGNTIHIYKSGAYNAKTACAAHLYLVDLTTKPVNVIAFGVKEGCNEFHWASWGKNRSVIAIKNNVKFIYENGKMTIPKDNEKLWKSIEPPHGGEGMEDDAPVIPFAVKVPPPQPIKP